MHLLDRRCVVAGLAWILSMPGLAAKTSLNERRILFVCQFGSVKSAIARELLRRRAREGHLPLAVQSRGITPEEHLPSATREELLKAGINPAAEPLRGLQQSDLDWADRVIIFDKLPARFKRSRVDNWTAVPSILNNYAEARSDLDRRIRELIHEEARWHQE